MAQFNYTAQDGHGKSYKGVVEAANKDKALNLLLAKGILVIDLKEAVKGVFGSRAGKNKVGSSKIPGHVMAFFAEQLATLIIGGVPIVRAILLLGEYSSDKKLGPVLMAVAADISGGNSFYGALSRFPKVFDHTWLSMVQAGEAGGHLSDALLQISKYVKSNEALKSKIITAVTYPAVLFLMSTGVLIYFVVGIVPTFASIFADFDMSLPVLTQIILMISTTIRSHLFLLLFLILCVAGIFKVAVTVPEGKKIWHNFHLRMPIFGPLISNIYFERILSTTAVLLQSGVSIINILNVIEEAYSGNVIMQSALRSAKLDVSSGKSLSEAFRKTHVFPGLMTEMMMMGEESGKLPSIMETLSKFYSEQINQFLARFSALIDPILIVGIGGIIGVVVLSIFMPIFKMSQIGMG
jgi:type IV pilus assembly protein PilC